MQPAASRPPPSGLVAVGHAAVGLTHAAEVGGAFETIRGMTGMGGAVCGTCWGRDLLFCSSADLQSCFPPFSPLAATFFQLSDNNVHQALLAAVHEVTFENVAALPGRGRVTCRRAAVKPQFSR